MMPQSFSPWNLMMRFRARSHFPNAAKTEGKGMEGKATDHWTEDSALFELSYSRNPQALRI